MDLRRIEPAKPIFGFLCAACGHGTESTEGFADLDGEAFRTYVCRPCMRDGAPETARTANGKELERHEERRDYRRAFNRYRTERIATLGHLGFNFPAIAKAEGGAK